MKKRAELTKGEEEIMLQLWKLGKGTISEIIELLPSPKPKYTTVATFMKLLEMKRYVTHAQTSKRFIYKPLVKKAQYAGIIFNKALTNYFDGSAVNMVAQMLQNGNIKEEEKAEIISLLNTPQE